MATIIKRQRDGRVTYQVKIGLISGAAQAFEERGVLAAGALKPSSFGMGVADDGAGLCIDCDVCVPDCPADVIYRTEDVLRDLDRSIDLRAELAGKQPVIVAKKDAPTDAEHWATNEDKRQYLVRLRPQEAKRNASGPGGSCSTPERLNRRGVWICGVPYSTHWNSLATGSRLSVRL